jgi:hypothetical protein
MWKIALAFIVFAAAALYLISEGGDKVDMTGEKHGADAMHAPASAVAASISAPAAASSAK